MLKDEFIEKLSKSLKRIPKKDRDYILYDYEEFFNAGMQEGKSEEDISRFLGDPIVIAKQFMADITLKQAEKQSSVQNVLKASYSVIGLRFVNISFVLPAMFILLLMIAIFFTFSIFIIAMGINSLVLTTYSYVTQSFMVTADYFVIVFLSIGATSAGLLLFLINISVSKNMLKKIVKLLKSVGNVNMTGETIL